MSTFGLTSAGFSPRRSSDFLTIIRDKYEALTGLDIDWEADVVLGNLTAIQADLNGEESELTASIYHSRVIGSATGIQLDDLCAAVGVYRDSATESTSQITLSGTSGTFVPAGSIVEGGGDNDDARWILQAHTTLAGGSGLVDATAEVAGATVATAGQIDKIVTPISGWSSVTNASDAAVGQARETDAELRVKRAVSLQVAGASSVNAIRASLAALDYLSAAVVLENDRSTSELVEGVVLDPNAIMCVVYPSGLTAAQQNEIAEIIYTKMVTGIYAQGTDVVKTVTDAAGGSKLIRFNYATALVVNVVYVLTYETGYSITDVQAGLEAAVTAHFATLEVGQSVTILDMVCLAGDITGIKGVATLTLNGGIVDIDPTILQLCTEGTVGIS